MSHTASPSSLPVARWFLYLLLASILTLAAPYGARPNDRCHSVNIQTFEETEGGLHPTKNKIWIDGPTYAKLNSGWWLGFALFLVSAELLVCLTMRLIRSRSSMPVTPP